MHWRIIYIAINIFDGTCKTMKAFLLFQKKIQMPEPSWEIFNTLFVEYNKDEHTNQQKKQKKHFTYNEWTDFVNLWTDIKKLENYAKLEMLLKSNSYPHKND